MADVAHRRPKNDHCKKKKDKRDADKFSGADSACSAGYVDGTKKRVHGAVNAKDTVP